MLEAGQLASVHAALSTSGNGIHLAPIRHHSPACAWVVRELIRSVRPECILIEAPVDFASHIDTLLDEDTRPPVAIAVLLEQARSSRVVGYYPFCSHSPEFVALSEGRAIGAELRFIDSPATDKAMIGEAGANGKLLLSDEAYFDSGDYIAGLCDRLGCRDGYELWDHLFESRIGDKNWRAFLADVGAYCAGLRESTSPEVIEANGDSARERHMSAMITAARSTFAGDIVVVAGGFHVPALLDKTAAENPQRAESSGTGAEPPASRSYLIRYGFKALDALNGYRAGLPQPRYYEHLWQCANAAKGISWRRQAALDLIAEFARHARQAGHDVTVPAQVEILRAAEALAGMRGHRGAARHDLIDAVRTALVKGQAGPREIWTERLLDFLCGTAIGDVPASAESPPLVEDARRRAQSLRIDVTDGARRKRRLDIRRKSSHLAASRYFHAMNLLETGFAERHAGPDLLHGVQSDRLFEEWSYAWSPQVEGRLLALAAASDRLPVACLDHIERCRADLQAGGNSRDIAGMTELLARGLLAGLGAELVPFVRALSGDIQDHGDFAAVARTLRHLHYIGATAGPLGAPKELNLSEITRSAYLRLIYLCDDLASTPKEAVSGCVEGLRLVAELLRNQASEILDRALFDDAINRVANAGPPGEILGAVLAICTQAGLRSASEICRALRGTLEGTTDSEEERVSVLRGVLHAAPELLWRSDELLRTVDELLCGPIEDRFIALLPHLRLAFGSLNPRESDRLAELLAQIHGARAGEFLPQRTEVSEGNLQRGLAIESRLRRAFSADGIEPWLLGREDHGH